MRARTRRLKSLWVVIVSVLWSAASGRSPAATPERRRKGSADTDPGVCPPLPHEDPRWGRAEEVRRGSPPVATMQHGLGRRKPTLGGIARTYLATRIGCRDRDRSTYWDVESCDQ